MKINHLPIVLLGSVALLGCDPSNTTTLPTTTMNDGSMKNTSSAAVNRDNSAVNIRDRETNAKTPLDQNENEVDIGITASIRKSVVDTKMSTNAQNVKIITQDGNVTLRGPVKTQEEKNRIEEIARNVAGVKAVDSQLEVE